MPTAPASIVLEPWFAALGGPDGAAPTADEPEVQRLVAAARQGDRRAARELYRQHVRPAFRAVRSLVRDDSEAEDVVQEAFVRALVHLERYRPRPGARFGSWLAAIALNEVRRRARWWRRVSGEPARDDGPCAEPGPDELLELSRRKAALLAALAELPGRDREVVALRYGAELTAAEVGQALGLSEANVRKICERQRKRLLERLGELRSGDETIHGTERAP